MDLAAACAAMLLLPYVSARQCRHSLLDPLHERGVSLRRGPGQSIVDGRQISDQNYLLPRPGQGSVQQIPGHHHTELHGERENHRVEGAALSLVDRQSIGRDDLPLILLRYRNMDTGRKADAPNAVSPLIIGQPSRPSDR